MRVKVTDPKYSWHLDFYDQEFEVCVECMVEGHHQYPVMTRYGQTWFDKDAVTVVEG